ncbi:MAG: alpha/beta hydrolase [Pseudomonadales bacterium]|nr:alpha/beta hydrolase [Pseudomonadales bacterium]
MKLERSTTLSLNYLDEGAGETTVLLMNGASLPLTFWGSFASSLAEQYRVVRFDARNAGDTEFSGGFTLGDIAADAAALLEHLGVERAVVVGHAWGGRVAQVFARDFPHRVQGLVICGTGGQFPAIDTTSLREEMVAARKAGDRATWASKMEAIYCAAGFRQRDPAAFESVADVIWNAVPNRAARWDMRAYPSEGYWGLATVPSLLLYGREDKFGTPQNAEALQGRLADTRLVMLDEAGHFIVREQESRVLAELGAFIDGL